jgi:hypothetical protein
MWELWVEYSYGWTWRVIGAVEPNDLLQNIIDETNDNDFISMRVVSKKEDRPIVLN